MNWFTQEWNARTPHTQGRTDSHESTEDRQVRRLYRQLALFGKWSHTSTTAPTTPNCNAPAHKCVSLQDFSGGRTLSRALSTCRVLHVARKLGFFHFLTTGYVSCVSWLTTSQAAVETRLKGELRDRKERRKKYKNHTIFSPQDGGKVLA